MRKNVGTVDASIRITIGLLGLAYGIGRMSRRPHRTPWLLMTMSAMKVAEGVTRFCPMLYSMGINTRTANDLGTAFNRLAEAGENVGVSRERARKTGVPTRTDRRHAEKQAVGRTSHPTGEHADEPQSEKQPERPKRTIKRIASGYREEERYPSYS